MFLNNYTFILFEIYTYCINRFYISTNITSSPIHLIFCHGITISFELEKKLKILLLPGTIIDVMVARMRIGPF